MKDAASIAIWLLVASAWGIVLSPIMSIYGVKPDIGMLIVVFMALSKRNHIPIIFGFLWGIVVDSIAPGDLGWSSLLYLLTGYGISFISTRFHWGTLMSQILLVFGAVVFFQTCHFIVLNFDDPYALILYFIRYGLTTGLYSAAIWGLLTYFPGIPMAGRTA